MRPPPLLVAGLGSAVLGFRVRVRVFMSDESSRTAQKWRANSDLYELMIIKLCEAGHVPQAYEVIKRMSVRPITSFHLSYHLTAERRSKYISSIVW